MAAHRAVLATKSGGVVDLIKPGQNGLLVEPTVDGLAKGLREMLVQPESTRAMGENAHQSIQAHTWTAVTDKYLQVFEDVIK